MSEIKKVVVFIGAVLFLGACMLPAGGGYEFPYFIAILGIILMVIPPLHTAWKNRKFYKQDFDEKDIDEK